MAGAAVELDDDGDVLALVDHLHVDPVGVVVAERVRDQFNNLLDGSNSVSSWSSRASMLTDAVGSAARHQSIENAPLLIFATAGAVLFLFMVRT